LEPPDAVSEEKTEVIIDSVSAKEAAKRIEVCLQDLRAAA